MPKSFKYLLTTWPSQFTERLCINITESCSLLPNTVIVTIANGILPLGKPLYRAVCTVTALLTGSSELKNQDTCTYQTEIHRCRASLTPICEVGSDNETDSRLLAELHILNHHTRAPTSGDILIPILYDVVCNTVRGTVGSLIVTFTWLGPTCVMLAIVGVLVAADREEIMRVGRATIVVRLYM